MYRYSAFSLTIDSELELPLFSEGAGEPDVVIRFGNVSPLQTPATIDNEFAFPANLGNFRITNGREIIVDPLPCADTSLLQGMLQGKLMACLLRQRGWFPLHASGIAIDGRAVLFVGESGAGKSTTAAAFHSRGHQVVTDDIGALRMVGCGAEIWTAWSGLRLRDDAREVIGNRTGSTELQQDKYLFHLDRRESTRSFPVSRIYFLEYSANNEMPDVRTDAMPTPWSVATLDSHSFLRHWRAGRTLRQINLARSVSIADAVGLHRLARPSSLKALPRLVDLVEKEVMAA